MKLKLIAAAAVLAASGVANAAIDNGTDGHGEFFFTIWDANSSYTFDLNLSQNTTASTVATGDIFSPGSAYSFNLAADAVFTQFLSTANLATLQWNLIAVESQSARTVYQTYSELPASGINATNGRSMVGSTQAWLNEVNTTLGSNSSVVFTSEQSAYAGDRLACNNFGFQNFSSCGTLANNSAETGLGLVSQSIATSGSALSTLAPIAYNGNAVKVYLDSNYNLQIAAVPEPETYAMLLAGLGLMGAIARRRQNKA